MSVELLVVVHRSSYCRVEWWKQERRSLGSLGGLGREAASRGVSDMRCVSCWAVRRAVLVDDAPERHSNQLSQTASSSDTRRQNGPDLLQSPHIPRPEPSAATATTTAYTAARSIDTTDAALYCLTRTALRQPHFLSCKTSTPLP